MKRCRVCRTLFDPRNSLQVVCSPRCAIEHAPTDAARAHRRRAERQAVRAYRSAAETLPKATRKAQAAFNAYIRTRDDGKPCISCGVIPEQAYGGTMDAGHYRSTGACPQLRFDERNCHAQCVRCNRDLSGNTVEYRIRLIERIGRETVEWLEGPHIGRKWDKKELHDIAARYRVMVREMRKEREAEWS